MHIQINNEENGVKVQMNTQERPCKPRMPGPGDKDQRNRTESMSHNAVSAAKNGWLSGRGANSPKLRTVC